MIHESKGNMYTWLTHTWNTIKGECPHGCTYCYMKRWGKQKPVRFDKSELKADLGSGNFIFVGSGCDMFANDIPPVWVIRTLNHCEKSKNSYLFQTKNPKAYSEYAVYIAALNDFVLCTTIETNRFYPEIMKNSPKPIERALAMDKLAYTKRYLTIEPIMDFDLSDLIELVKFCHPKQVNIGADSGNNHLPEPSKEKILALIDELKKFTVIDQKRNLTRLLK